MRKRIVYLGSVIVVSAMVLSFALANDKRLLTTIKFGKIGRHPVISETTEENVFYYINHKGEVGKVCFDSMEKEVLHHRKNDLGIPKDVFVSSGILVLFYLKGICTYDVKAKAEKAIVKCKSEEIIKVILNREGYSAGILSRVRFDIPKGLFFTTLDDSKNFESIWVWNNRNRKIIRKLRTQFHFSTSLCLMKKMPYCLVDSHGTVYIVSIKNGDTAQEYVEEKYSHSNIVLSNCETKFATVVRNRPEIEIWKTRVN